MKMFKLLTLLFLALSSTAYAETLKYEQVHKIAFKAVTEYFSYIDTIEVKDVKAFCPSYNGLSSDERQNFFAHLLTGISKYESSFKKDTTFSENSGVSSKGLIGLSYKITQNKNYQKYGCYAIKEKKDIMNPGKSMRCAMAIIEKWLRSDKVISHQYKNIKGNRVYRGAARYWSTLRTPYKVTLVNYNNRVVTVGKRALVISSIKKNYPLCF
jgi:hypothetical protein